MQKLMRDVCFAAVMALALTGGDFCFGAEAAPKVVSSTPLAGVQWHPLGKQVTYLRSVRSHDVVMGYDVEKASEKVLYDPQPEGGEAPPIKLPLGGYKWSPAGDALLLRHEGDLWVAPVSNGPNGKAVRITQDAEEEELVSFSPDGNKIAFVKKNNLFVADVHSGTVTQLTTDGSETILNAKLDWVYGEELEEGNPSGRAYAWSPDSRRIAFLRLDQALVPEYPIVDFFADTSDGVEAALSEIGRLEFGADGVRGERGWRSAARSKVAGERGRGICAAGVHVDAGFARRHGDVDEPRAERASIS